VVLHGSLTRRRVWAQLDLIPLPDGSLAYQSYMTHLGRVVVPDGICLDAKGAIWLASPGSSGVVGVRQGGELTQRIEVETAAVACLLGGEDRCTLFVLTTDWSENGGRIETVKVDVPGAGLP
jgi:sugar lactone lactonase YvrE